MAYYGIRYGIFSGATLAISSLIFWFDPITQNRFLNVLFTLACSPFMALGGALMGMVMGFLLALIDSMVVALVIYYFWYYEILWEKRSQVLSINLVSSFLINHFLVIVIFKPQSTLTPILIIVTSIATVAGIIHFHRWYYNYLTLHPDILYDYESEMVYVEGGYDYLTYEVPPIPTNLTQYDDGELPAEILRQFPVDRI